MQHLLDKVSEIDRQNRAAIDEMWGRGECFNIFDILNVQSYEVTTHSAFLRELLSPDGSHGMKDKFLKLFIQSIPGLSALCLNTKSAVVETEISDNVDGRLDILIKSGSKAVVIENKIYAGDQEDQLNRYSRYLQQYEESRLLYLTLDGVEASDYSASGMEVGLDYIAISYSTDIMQWLEKCLAASEGVPMVYYSIKQYINLIKELTYQMMDNECHEEIMDLLCKDENVEKTAKILCYYDELKERILEERLFSKLEAWCKYRKFEFRDDNRFYFRPADWKNHWIVIDNPRTNYDVGIWKERGRDEKCMQLNVLSDGVNKAWPFGWISIKNIIYDYIGVANGSSLKALEKLLSSILKEINERQEEIVEKKIIL